MDKRHMPKVSTYSWGPISKRRILKGLTQQTAAKLIGVSYVAYNRWESGKAKPSAENLVKLAKLYDCTIDELLEEEGHGRKKRAISTDPEGSSGALQDQHEAVGQADSQ